MAYKEVKLSLEQIYLNILLRVTIYFWPAAYVCYTERIRFYFVFVAIHLVVSPMIMWILYDLIWIFGQKWFLFSSIIVNIER